MDQFLTHEKIVEDLSIAPGQIIADFGAGHGYFTLDFAKSVGPSGQVFAIDILPSAIEAISSRAKLAGVFNITTIRSDLERERGSTLPDNRCDLVLAANILFQAKDKSAVVKEALRVLKPSGRFVIIEWHENLPLGPSKGLRINESQLKQLILGQNFQEAGSIDAGSHHYGLIFIKPNA